MLNILLILVVNHLIASNKLLGGQLFLRHQRMLYMQQKKHVFIWSLIKHILFSQCRVWTSKAVQQARLDRRNTVATWFRVNYLAPCSALLTWQCQVWCLSYSHWQQPSPGISATLGSTDIPHGKFPFLNLSWTNMLSSAFLLHLKGSYFSLMSRVCFITPYFSNCTIYKKVDGTWRHAQIRIHFRGFSAVLCWAQAVLLLLLCSQQFCYQRGQGHLFIIHLSILEPLVPCPSLVTEGMFYISIQSKEPYVKPLYSIPSLAP